MIDFECSLYGVLSSIIKFIIIWPLYSYVMLIHQLDGYKH